jgi:DNA polymerase-3 subunit alpha
MKINDNGSVQFEEDEALELLYQGIELKNISLVDDTFNTWVKFWNKTSDLSLEKDEKSLEQRRNEWLFVEFPEFDIRQELIERCKTQEEINRINMEMDLFEERDLIPILRLMFYIVDVFRTNKVVFGVGRGSSVSSFVLFKIGIHKIDSIKYGLDIKDFLK